MIALVVALIGLLQAILSLVAQKGGEDRVAFLLKTSQIISDLTKAKTLEDHQNAAKNLADLIASQPPK